MSILENIKQVIADLERLRPQIESAMSYNGGTHTFDDLVSMVMTGRLRLWAFDQSVALTEIIEYPREKHYHVFIAGGKLSELTDAMDDLLSAAQQAGCSKITISGRKGFVKALAGHGWKEQSTRCSYEV